MTPHSRMDHWRALFDAHPTRRVNRINYVNYEVVHAATQHVIEQRYAALESRRADPEYQRNLRARQKRKAEAKRKKELLEASTPERKLYMLMQHDAQVQKERMFREHVRDTESPDDSDHRFMYWHHAGRPEVWLDGRATCTVAEFVEEYEHLCGVEDSTK